jgi:hypothetical protein
MKKIYLEKYFFFTNIHEKYVWKFLKFSQKSMKNVFEIFKKVFRKIYEEYVLKFLKVFRKIHEKYV